MLRIGLEQFVTLVGQLSNVARKLPIAAPKMKEKTFQIIIYVSNQFLWGFQEKIYTIGSILLTHRNCARVAVWQQR